MLEADGLVKRFATGGGLLGRGRRVVHAVEDVSLRVEPGRTLALVGESGCGKSTVGRLLVRLLEPDAGRIALDGAELGSLSDAELRPVRRRLQIVFQDPWSALNPRRTVGEAVGEPIAIHDRPDPAALRARVEALLARVGLGPAHARRFPAELSGGQRQRVVIARALAAGPSYVFADEPVSALDVSVRAQILNLLRDVQAERGIGYLLVSHDLAVVRHVADAIAVMYLGRIVEEGEAAALLAEPRHPYTRALLAASPATRAALAEPPAPLEGEPPSPIDPPRGCPLHPRCPLARAVGPAGAARCAEELPELRAVGSLRVRCHHAER